MKKLTILSLFITILVLTGCDYISSPIRIIAVEDYSQDNVCIYITNQVPNLTYLKFIAPCGTFQVGDTLKLIKQ